MMKRKLLTQMRKEWRSNFWMTVELFVVGLVLCLIFAILNCFGEIHQEPQGADYSDIYLGNIGYIGYNEEAFRPYADDEHSHYTDLQTLMANIRQNPNVETVGTGSNALPYNYSYIGEQIKPTSGNESPHFGNVRQLSPEVITAIRLRGINGETPEELADMVSRGELLFSPAEWGGEDTDIQSLRGHDVIFGSDSSDIRRVGAIINPIRRSDYEPANGVIITKDSGYSPGEVIVRVRDGRGREFLSSLSGDDMEFGNVYVSNLRSLDDDRDECHREISTLQRNIITCAVFLLVSVFLGFLGSFWYRTQHRVPELALRKVNGATNADLMRRFVGEGMILLILAAILMIPAVLLLTKFLGGGDSFTEIYLNGLPMPTRIIRGSFLMSVGSLAVMILAGIWMPARKAMKIEPAIALKEQ